MQAFLDSFFQAEVDGAKKGASDLKRIKRTTIFFNFVQKHGTYQAHVFDEFCAWIKQDEFFEI